MSWIVSLFAVYVFIIVAVYFLQRFFIYHPDIQTPVIPVRLNGTIEEITVSTDDGYDLDAWFTGPSQEKPVIVFFHGNAGNYGDRALKAEKFTSAGYGVLLAEYRGYGGNLGKPAEQGLYNDARAYLKWLFAAGFGSKDIILYGETLGTGVAVQMASEYETAGIVLETPFTSMADAAAYHFPWLPVAPLIRDKYDSISKIRAVREPILVVHGTSDKTVPYAMGRKLYEFARGDKKMVTVRGAGHNNLYEWGVAVHIIAFMDGITGKMEKRR